MLSPYIDYLDQTVIDYRDHSHEQPVQLLKGTKVPIAAEKAREVRRLRIRTQRHCEHFHVCRTAVGLSTGNRPRASD